MQATAGPATATGSAGPATRSWNVSRAKCAVYAVGLPVALAAISAIVAAVMLGGEPAAGADPPDGALVVGTLVVFTVVVSLLGLRELLPLALRGGGLTAGPDGLGLRLGAKAMLFRWSLVKGVGVEGRSVRRGSSYDVLAIRFAGTGFRWPRAFSLWFSQPTCLCISPTILEQPAAVVAAEIEEARLAFALSERPSDWATYRSGAGPRYTEPRGEGAVYWARGRARLLGRLLAVGTFALSLVCVYWGVAALLRLDLFGVVAWLLFLVGTVAVGLGLWFFGADILGDE